MMRLDIFRLMLLVAVVLHGSCLAGVELTQETKENYTLDDGRILTGWYDEANRQLVIDSPRARISIESHQIAIRVLVIPRPPEPTAAEIAVEQARLERDRETEARQKRAQATADEAEQAKIRAESARKQAEQLRQAELATEAARVRKEHERERSLDAGRRRASYWRTQGYDIPVGDWSEMEVDILARRLVDAEAEVAKAAQREREQELTRIRQIEVARRERENRKRAQDEQDARDRHLRQQEVESRAAWKAEEDLKKIGTIFGGCTVVVLVFLLLFSPWLTARRRKHRHLVLIRQLNFTVLLLLILSIALGGFGGLAVSICAGILAASSVLLWFAIGVWAQGKSTRPPDSTTAAD